MTKVSGKPKITLAKKGANKKSKISKPDGVVKSKVKKIAPAARVEVKTEVKPLKESLKKKTGETKKAIVKNEKKTTVKNENSKIEEIPNVELKCTKEHVAKCVNAVFKLAEKDENNKNLLLSDFNSPIFLQVNAVKVPETPRRTARIHLPHSLVGENDDVAVFVPDVRKGLRQNYEATIDHWETIFRQKNVTSIKEIIPMNRVKTEFRQFEEKMKLGKLFDFFLVEGRIAGHLTGFLGKTFLKTGRKPVPVKLQRDNLKEEIDQALKKTSLEIHGNGNSHTVQIGSCTMEENSIVDNVLAAVDEIKKVYPGGEENIRSLMIKTKMGMGIPIYYSMANKNKVAVPVVAGKRPKGAKVVEGELSTVKSGAIVSVSPGGKVEKRKAAADVKEEETQPKKIKIEEKKNKEKIKVEPVVAEDKKNKVEDKKINKKKITTENIKIEPKVVAEDKKIKITEEKIIIKPKKSQVEPKVEEKKIKITSENIKIQPKKIQVEAKVPAKDNKIKITPENKKIEPKKIQVEAKIPAKDKKIKMTEEKITIKPKKTQVEPKVEQVAEKKVNSMKKGNEEKKVKTEKQVSTNVDKEKKIKKVDKTKGKEIAEKKSIKKSKMVVKN